MWVAASDFWLNQWDAKSTQTVLQDAYQRTASPGWVSADTGGVYTYRPNNVDFSVNGSRGVIVPTAANANRFALLLDQNWLDQDVQLTFSFSLLPSSQVQFFMFPRYAGTNDYYRLNFRLTSTALTWGVDNVIAGVATPLTGQASTTGLTPVANTDYTLRVQALGTNPTTIRGKVWLASTAEPAAWGIQITDSVATALQTAAGFGWGLSTGAPTTHPTWTFDDLLGTTFTTSTVVAPVVTFVSQSRGTISANAPADTDDVVFSVDQDYQAYQVRVVSSSAATVSQGTLVESGTGGTADVQKTITITRDELVAASAVEGSNMVKIFAQGPTGIWSGG